MTLNNLLTRLNTILAENPKMGEVQVYGIEQAECRSFESVDLMLVDKNKPTSNCPLDFNSVLINFDNFQKENYVVSVVLGWD